MKIFPNNLTKIIEKLKEATYSSNELRYQIKERLLSYVFQRVAVEDFCIRVASRIFTLSAGYYFQIFFNFKIKGFYPERMIAIT